MMFTSSCFFFAKGGTPYAMNIISIAFGEASAALRAGNMVAVSWWMWVGGGPLSWPADVT